MDTPAYTIRTHRGPLTSMAVADDLLATAGQDGYWRLWDIRKLSEEPLYRVLHNGKPPKTLDLSQNGKLALGHGPHIEVWDTQELRRTAVDGTRCDNYLNHALPGRVGAALGQLHPLGHPRAGRELCEVSPF
eukprot:Polyplicarium_translucidae@DN3141_c0_g1_i8.p4